MLIPLGWNSFCDLKTGSAVLILSGEGGLLNGGSAVALRRHHTDIKRLNQSLGSFDANFHRRHRLPPSPTHSSANMNNNCCKQTRLGSTWVLNSSEWDQSPFNIFKPTHFRMHVLVCDLRLTAFAHVVQLMDMYVLFANRTPIKSLRIADTVP